MKQLSRVFIIALLAAACASGRKGKVSSTEKMPDIAGTWYHNGDTTLPCYIVQNKESLVLMAGGQTSSAVLRSSYEIFAKEWNANAILSADHTTLKWPDRKWVKGTFRYPDISGAWYENGELGKKITITQNATKLVMDNGVQVLHGYFYTTNAIYSMENNNYASYNPNDNTITWGEKKWRRTGK